MMRYVILMLLAVFATPFVYAGDYGFETTSEGMVKALTRSVTRSYPSALRAIKVVKKKAGKTVQQTVMVSETPSPQSVNIKIEFNTDSYAIRPESFHLLNKLGKAITSDNIRDKTVIVKGHTDADGSDAYNLKLSLNRAESVKNYLLGNFDITPDRIQVMGYGEAMPLVPNTSATNKQLNRRVEIQALP